MELRWWPWAVAVVKFEPAGARRLEPEAGGNPEGEGSKLVSSRGVGVAIYRRPARKDRIGRRGILSHALELRRGGA